MLKLKVNGRYLAFDNGEPFFYLGDTAWELFHKLSREEAEYFLSERSRQGFTAVQAVALAEFDGLTVPNYYGRLPFLFTDNMPDPEKPDCSGDYSYWNHVDYIIKTAEKYNIFMTILPTWGDKINLCWGKGPVVFSCENAYTYGKWLANRYKNNPNIIWMLGGDRPLEENHRKIIDSMAKGIREEDTYHLITFHPVGGRCSTDFVGDAEYIDFHTSQTGHGVDLCYKSDSVMEKMACTFEKPFLDSEPRYEDHPACFNDKIGYYWNCDDVRQNAYWNVLSGACGHTYGNHCIWSMNREANSYFPYIWKDALTHTGAEQIKHVKNLRLKYDYFSFKPNKSLIAENFEGMAHMTAGSGNGYGFIYSPLGIPFKVNLSAFENINSLKAIWYNPRTGEEELFAVLPPHGQTVVAPPSQGKGCDWVLILECVR